MRNLAFAMLGVLLAVVVVGSCAACVGMPGAVVKEPTVKAAVNQEPPEPLEPGGRVKRRSVIYTGAKDPADPMVLWVCLEVEGRFVCLDQAAFIQGVQDRALDDHGNSTQLYGLIYPRERAAARDFSASVLCDLSA
jgi:hypothetical protein